MLQTLAPSDAITPAVACDDAAPVRTLLRVQPTQRPYPLLEFLQRSPLLRRDIARGSPGLSLTLNMRIVDARGRPIEHAAVYIWHYDARCWTIDFQGDELDAITCMRGVQISDADGAVGFHTVYPRKYRDNTVPVYLQIYFNNGRQVTARSDVCLLLPEEADGPLKGVPLADPLPARTTRPRFSDDGDSVLLTLDRLSVDLDTGGLRGDVRIGIDL
jgi:hypothetical protein